MTPDELEYLVRAGTVGDGKRLCFHLTNTQVILGTVSKLARHSGNTVGVELVLEADPDVPEVTTSVFVPASVVVLAEWMR